MAKKITKAVIAAAGQGTRFLPQTKASPKEMMPVINKPVIQYVVEELVAAGVEDIIIVTGSQKRVIEDHFDRPNLELVEALSSPSKKHFLDEVNRIADLANFVYLRQKGGKGNAIPLMNAAHLIGDEPFIYAYADEFFLGEGNRFKQMVDVYERTNGAVFSCIEVAKDEEYSKYGIVSGQQVEDGLIKMDTIVEKPGKENAPSSLASVSSYVLNADFLQQLEADYKQHDHASGEFMIQTPMQHMIDQAVSDFYALKIRDSRYCDCGTPEAYIKTVNYAAQLAGLNIS